MTLAPDVWPDELLLLLPLEPPDELLSSPPHEATNRPHISAAHNIKTKRFVTSSSSVLRQ
jgi:hypothetical protein